jgi:hypothetical protein
MEKNDFDRGMHESSRIDGMTYYKHVVKQTGAEVRDGRLLRAISYSCFSTAVDESYD